VTGVQTCALPIYKKVKSQGIQRMVYGLEVLVSLYVTYILAMLVLILREPLAAGYLAIVSICTYALITIIQFIKIIFVKNHNLHHSKKRR